MSSYIEPRILKGFRDSLPATEIARRDLFGKLERFFRSYGFVPIDTPALEYSEILLGKGGGETDKQMYRFKDNGGRDVALRFDLTIPFARFLAERRSELTLPFKRYHIAKVWRGENTQRGRYREFTQCDFDTVGSDSAACDFEILHIMQKALREIAGGNVAIRINHRGLFNRFLARLGTDSKSVEILRIVDKLAKIGGDETLKLLSEQVDSGKAKEILSFVGIKGGFDATLAAMTAAAGEGSESERLKLIRRFMVDSGIQDSFILDPSITRGLDYYTGVVFESFLADLPEIGSVCSGGRYDNLVALYTSDKRPQDSLSGIGASIGIDRLIAGLEALGRMDAKLSTAAAAIACVDEASGGLYQALADKLRDADLSCEVFTEAHKLPRQYQQAEKKGIKWLIIADGGNAADGPLTLRNLEKRENIEGLKPEELVKIIKNCQKT